MRSETKSAGSGGVITMNSGYSMCAVPVRGALWNTLTLNLERGGALVAQLEYEPGRVLALSKWDSATLSGAVPNSAYRVLVGEAATEQIGRLSREPVVLLAGEVQWEGTAGNAGAAKPYYVTNRNALPGGTITASVNGNETYFDVSTASRVELIIRAPKLVDAAGITLEFFLDCYNDFYTPGGSTGSQADQLIVAAGTSNNFASSSSGVAGSIVVGADVVDGATAFTQQVSTRPRYVAPRFVLSGGNVEQDGVFFLELKAWP